MDKRQVRVLSVEDNPQVAEIIKLTLEESGIETVAATGEESLLLASSQEFDLILLDIRLPGISGIEVCKRLKQHAKTKDTPVVFVTGEGSVKARDAAECGAVDVLYKPFGGEELVTIVRRHLRG